jgi:hypothetical protein
MKKQSSMSMGSSNDTGKGTAKKGKAADEEEEVNIDYLSTLI